MQTTEIIFVRHGQTRSNVEGLLHGRTDVDLTDDGLRQAQRVARRLAWAWRDAVHQLYSSPLRRAWTTAEVVGSSLNLSPIAHPALTEFDFGDFEGLTLAAIQHNHPEIYRRIGDLSDIEFGFPNGESRGAFHRRVAGAMQDLLKRHRSQRIVVVAHGGVIGSAIAQMTGGDPNDWSRHLVDNCSITHLEVRSSAPAHVHCFNEVAHLEEIY